MAAREPSAELSQWIADTPLDPDATLKSKIVEFVARGDFGIGQPRDRWGYDRMWFQDLIAPDEVGFDPGVFLLKRLLPKGSKPAPAVLPRPLGLPSQSRSPSPRPLQSPVPDLCRSAPL
jgi:hypothetical protein